MDLRVLKTQKDKIAENVSAVTARLEKLKADCQELIRKNAAMEEEIASLQRESDSVCFLRYLSVAVFDVILIG